MDTERLIIESSVILLGLFSAASLLFQGASQQFKDTYVYFGYMLYFGFPFIFAVIFATVSLVTTEELVNRVLLAFSVSFFVSGFVVLFLLASVAAQSAVLPSSFSFIFPIQTVVSLENALGAIFLGAQGLGKFVSSVKKNKVRIKLGLLTLGFVLTLLGATLLSIYSVQTILQNRETKSVSLKGLPHYETYYANFSMVPSDQISVRIVSNDNTYFHYSFLNEQNYYLYQNQSTRDRANFTQAGYEKETYFLQTISAGGKYHLAIESGFFLGTNATYVAEIYHVENSNMGGYFAIMVAGIFFVLLVSNHLKTGEAASKKHQPADT